MHVFSRRGELLRRSAAKLALEDGRVFLGKKFGAAGTSDGEVCFNTALTGYQEILTDPSYCGQIVTMTYPQIGNYGINSEDLENDQPHLSGFVVRDVSRIASNFRASETLEQYLQRHQIVGISDIDTRALVRHLRSRGAMKGVISSQELDDNRLVAMAKASPGLVGRDLVREVVPQSIRRWEQPLHPLMGRPLSNQRPMQVVALDFGMKYNIARHLVQTGFDVMILPGTSRAEEVLAHTPDGVFLSNGPGDPEPLGYAIECVRQLVNQLPVFGICLGHQLMALACGAKTFKLKFGHRGANQPVINCLTGRVEITAQNHGFAVDEASLPSSLEITHRNLNDNTIAGLRCRDKAAFGVQYHPEASAGPHDSFYLFDSFRALMARSPAQAF